MRQRSLWLVTLLLGKMTVAAPYPDASIQGQTYTSACAKTEWPHLAAALNDAAQGRQPAQLRRLAWLILCGQGAADNARLHRHMPPLLAVQAEDNDTSAVTVWHPRKAFSTLGGHAWDATVRLDGDRIWLAYLSNEACAASVGLSWQKKRWHFHALREACD